MDKYNLVFDLIDNPGKYSAEELESILSDNETQEIYNVLCKANMAIEADKEIDVEVEWKRFSDEHHVCRRGRFAWFGSRVASISVIICTSIVAIAAGIAVSVALIAPGEKTDADSINRETVTSSIIGQTDKNALQTDSTELDLAPVVFENESLETIMKMVASYYDVDIKFNNKEAASLHLYYKLNPALPLDEVVSQLNTFEQINITINGDVLSVD